MVFGHNRLRWHELQNTFNTKTLTKTTFETLKSKPTQWAGNTTQSMLVKQNVSDIMRCVIHISKEWNEIIGIKRKKVELI